MTAELISVDFKQGKVIERASLAAVETEDAGPDLAQNKRLINDLKSMMDDIAGDVDLYPAILLIPNEDCDLYVKVNGTQIGDADIKAIGRIQSKLRQRNVKP